MQLDTAQANRLIASLRVLCLSKAKALDTWGEWRVWVDCSGAVHFQPARYFYTRPLQCEYAFKYFQGRALYFHNGKRARGIPRDLVENMDTVIRDVEVGLILANQENLERLLQSMLFILKNGPRRLKNFYPAPGTRNIVSAGHRVRIKIYQRGRFARGFEYHFEQFPLKVKRLARITRDKTHDATPEEVEEFARFHAGEFYDELKRMALACVEDHGAKRAALFAPALLMVHRVFLEYFPLKTLRLCTDHNIGAFAFLQTDWDLEPAMGDGINREFMNLLGKSIFSTPHGPFLIQDGYPHYDPRLALDAKLEISSNIMRMFYACHASATMKIGNRLPRQFFDALEGYRTLWARKPDNKARELDDALRDYIPQEKFYAYVLDFPMGPEHRRAADFVKTGAVSEILQHCADIVNDMLLPAVKPLIELIHLCWEVRQRLNFVVDRSGPMIFTAETVMGQAFDRQQIADLITTDGGAYLQSCLAQLKEHILNASQTWVENFLVAVTGSSTIIAETRIKLQGVQGTTYPTSRTCFQILNVPTQPRDGTTFIQLIDEFVQNAKDSFTDQ